MLRTPTPLDLSTASRDEWTTTWMAKSSEVMNAIYREHAAAIRHRARGVCGAEDAADVTQEVLLRFWRNPAGFDPSKGSLRTYLLVLAHGVAVDLVRSSARRRQRDQRSVAPAASGEVVADRMIEPILRRETAMRVNAALDQLDPRHREAITARFFDGVSFGEAARRDGVPEGTVKSRVRLGLERLRPALADLHDGSQKKRLVMRDTRSSKHLPVRGGPLWICGSRATIAASTATVPAALRSEDIGGAVDVSDVEPDTARYPQ